ncbi:MAG: hypothetical protein HMLKMBBP_01712 [Planctomycetes bacterium]|nr:hypothetical protein [Planctomycetota bacterium]
MSKLLVPAVLIGLGVAGLVTVGILEGGIPELQVREAAGAPAGKQVKIHGLLASVEHDGRPLRFTLKDKEQAGRTVAVTYPRGKPDTFQVDYDVAVLGTYDAATNTVSAEQIFTKCPSKYEALEKEGVGSAQMQARTKPESGAAEGTPKRQ